MAPARSFSSRPSLDVLREHVLERRADEEVLLLEAQLLALRRRVVRIQHAREILRVDLLGHRRRVVALVEGLDPKRRDRASRPQAQMIDGGTAIAGNHQVVADGPDVVRADPLVAHASAFIALRLAVAAEAHAMAHGAAAAFPEVVKAQPGARDFALRAVLADHLREDAVVVANAVARRGVTERRERIEKARGEAAKTAVAEPRIFFLGGDPVEIVAEATRASRALPRSDRRRTRTAR